MHKYCQDSFLDSIDLFTQSLGVYQILLWTQRLFSRRPLDVTGLWPEIWAFRQKEPTCQLVFAWTLNCVYVCITTEVVAIAYVDDELLIISWMFLPCTGLIPWNPEPYELPWLCFLNTGYMMFPKGRPDAIIWMNLRCFILVTLYVYFRSLFPPLKPIIR